MKARYINPFTDFGFKKIFGEEASKPQLIDFLNSLLPAESQIKSLTFKNTEQFGQSIQDRKALFDIYCEGENGKKFIVELQKAKQNFFKERTIYYSTFPIREQAEKGDWNYNLTPVYCIGILDFTFEDYETEPEKSEVFHSIKLKNQNGKVFYEKLEYIYLEMPNFKLSESELGTKLDKWLYFIKHLENFEKIPEIFAKDYIFEGAFEKAEIAQLNQMENENYERSLKEYRDMKGYLDTAFETGKEEGLQEGLQEGLKEGLKEGLQEGLIKGMEKGKKEKALEIAKQLKAMNINIDVISNTTGLSVEEINNL